MQKTVHIADVKTWEDYRSLFKNVSVDTAIGEGSNSYLFYPSSAGLIAQRFPHANIIMILLNPLDKAWVHYLVNQNLVIRYCQIFYRKSIKTGIYNREVRASPQTTLNSAFTMSRSVVSYRFSRRPKLKSPSTRILFVSRFRLFQRSVSFLALALY
jgi:hypothetical protein